MLRLKIIVFVTILGSTGLLLPLLVAVFAQLCDLRGEVLPVPEGVRGLSEARLLLAQEVQALISHIRLQMAPVF